MSDLAAAIARWDRLLGLRRTAVLFVTLWMTWRSFTWAAEYASALLTVEGPDKWLSAAAMVAAVLAPIAALQAAVFKSYIESKPGGAS